MKILVINPGSTSTKIALYHDSTQILQKNLFHPEEQLNRFHIWTDQLNYRYNLILNFLKEADQDLKSLDCVISRGGSPPGIHAGATLVDERLCDALLHRPLEHHPACLGPVIAKKIADSAGIKAYVYDPITSDDLSPLAKVYGVKGIEHNSMCHFLNTHAMAILYSEKRHQNLDDLAIAVAHIGGGNSICLWNHGRPTDVVPGDACTFSAERAGFMRSERMVQLVEEYGPETVTSWLHGKGGFVSLLGTNDLREVEKMIAGGNQDALLYQQAMAFQLSRCICSLLPSADGHFDAIIITGGGANWKRLTDDIQNRLSFLKTDIAIMPGEHEMQALADGAVRILEGKETVHTYMG